MFPLSYVYFLFGQWSFLVPLHFPFQSFSLLRKLRQNLPFDSFVSSKGDSKDAPAREAATTNGFDGFVSALPSASSTSMTTSAQSPLPEDSFGVWGRPVGPEHHDPAYGLMHPHDALEMNRDRTRRSMTVPQRILVAGDEGTSFNLMSSKEKMSLTHSL